MNDERRPKAPTESATTKTIVSQDARRRRDQVKLLLTRMTEQTNMVGNILEEAQTAGDHLTLGYESWTKYIVGEYAGKLADLDRAKRREVVGSLTAAGMSTRAIAGVVGTSHKTVVKDLQVQVVPEVPPDREDHQDSVDRRVTGLDGKSYSKLHTVPSRPVIEPRTMRQTSLPKQYFAAVRDLDKAVRRLEKLHASDRFAANRETLFELHVKALVHGHDALYDMVLQLANMTHGDIAESVDLVKPKFGWTQ